VKIKKRKRSIMNNGMSVSDWVFDVLNFNEKFTTGEVCQALSVKTELEKKRISRNLSYLVEKKLVERLSRGIFKNLSRRKEFSGYIGEIGYYCCPKESGKDGDPAPVRFARMKLRYEEDGFIFKKQDLWKYDNSTAMLYEAYNPTGNSDYLNNKQYLLLIGEDDPQRERVIRYVGRKAEGISMFVYQDGDERGDIRHLFPNAPWLL
jgi:hypothetical protein